jgi:phosphatidylglycerophosphatase A
LTAKARPAKSRSKVRPGKGRRKARAATGADRFARLVTSACGAGFMPIAPGTWGSAVAVVAVYAAYLLAPARFLTPASAAVMLGASLALAWIGICAGDRVSALLGNDDPSEVVIDEVVGQLLTYSLLPLAGRAWGGWSFEVALAAGFFLFRGLDIFKPGPIDALQNAHGGLGIMADDFAAGIVGMWIMLVGALMF